MAAGVSSDTISVEYESTNFQFIISGGVTAGYTLPAGGTDYLALTDNTSSGTELDKQAELNLPYTTTASNLWIYISANSINNSSTFTFRKNGVDTALTVTIGALSTGAFEDTTNTVDVIATDLMNYKMVEGAGPTKSITLRHFSLLMREQWPSVHIKGGTILGGSIK